MRDRLKKKSEKRKRELIHEMLDLVLDINGLGRRDQEYTGNLPTAFFNFSGHVGWVEVRINSQGYCGGYPDKEIRAHSNRQAELKEAICEMGSIKAETPAAGTTERAGLGGDAIDCSEAG